MNFNKVKIAAVDRPLKDVISLILDIPQDQFPEFNYSPGHHVVLRTMKDGIEIRRPYALSSSPFSDERPTITIERKKGGQFSEYIFEHAKYGAVINISDPFGFFYADVNSEDNKDYYLFAQGVCISPLFSILKSILIAETTSKVFLLYESKNKDSIIFENELKTLRSSHPNRFVLCHTLSNPGLLPRITPWNGTKGKIDENSIAQFLQNNLSNNIAEYFICGDKKLNTTIRQHLKTLDIEEARIHSQLFYLPPSSQEKIGDNSVVNIQVEGQNTQHVGIQSQTILQTLQNSQQDVPYGCESGICGACAAKLKSGSVKMARTEALEQVDIDAGWILTCQACPTSDNITLEL